MTKTFCDRCKREAAVKVLTVAETQDYRITTDFCDSCIREVCEGLIQDLRLDLLPIGSAPKVIGDDTVFRQKDKRREQGI